MAEKRRISYTILINHRSCISQNTIDPYTFCVCQIGARNKPYPLCFILEKQVFWQRWSYLSIDCNSVRQFFCAVMTDLLSGTGDAPMVTITHGSTVSQICHNSSPLTLSILNKLSWNVITPCFEQKTRSVNSKATAHQQQLQPQIPSFDIIQTLQTHWHQNTIWTFHFRRSLSWLTRRQWRP